MNDLIVPEQEEKKNEVIVVEQLPDYAILNPEIPMSAKVEVATKVANTLAPLVREQGLAIKGLNKKNKGAEYVMVEGWEVLGTFLGIVPVTTIIEDIKNKQGRTVGYKARATLYQNPIIKNDEIVGGTVIARAEAQADKSGYQNDMFAIASMAQTRALGKAYRMGLSWIMKMAGFEGTPAEEMPKYKEADVIEAEVKEMIEPAYDAEFTTAQELKEAETEEDGEEDQDKVYRTVGDVIAYATRLSKDNNPGNILKVINKLHAPLDLKQGAREQLLQNSIMINKYDKKLTAAQILSIIKSRLELDDCEKKPSIAMKVLNGYHKKGLCDEETCRKVATYIMGLKLDESGEFL